MVEVFDPASTDYPCGGRERLRWQGPAAYTKDRTVLLSEREPHKNKTIIVKCNKYLVMSPRQGSTPRLTD
jgi:hypothetical protein